MAGESELVERLLVGAKADVVDDCVQLMDNQVLGTHDDLHVPIRPAGLLQPRRDWDIIRPDGNGGSEMAWQGTDAVRGLAGIRVSRV